MPKSVICWCTPNIITSNPLHLQLEVPAKSRRTVSADVHPHILYVNSLLYILALKSTSASNKCPPPPNLTQYRQNHKSVLGRWKFRWCLQVLLPWQSGANGDLSMVYCSLLSLIYPPQVAVKALWFSFTMEEGASNKSTKVTIFIAAKSTI